MKKLLEQKYFLLSLLLGIGIIFKMHVDNTAINNIYGLADTKETVLSTKFPVVVKKVHVYPGQKVYQGDLLIEGESHEVNLQLYKLQSELAALRARNMFNKAMNEHLSSVDVVADKKYAYTNPLQYQIASLVRQIKVLEKERSELNIYAPNDATVGVVNTRPGEKLAAFTPLLTLVKTTPLFIRGYIHEYVNAKTFRNQKVKIRSFTTPTEYIYGSVVEIGDRIVQFPQQILRGDSATLWGREVIIALPKDNAFRVGEKVFLQLMEDSLVIERDELTGGNLISKASGKSRNVEL